MIVYSEKNFILINMNSLFIIYYYLIYLCYFEEVECPISFIKQASSN